MTVNGIPEFNFDDLTIVDYDYCSANFGFDGLDYQADLSQVAGPSQPYTGVEVLGDSHNYPDIPSPSTTPTSLYLAHGTYSNEGKLCCPRL